MPVEPEVRPWFGVSAVSPSIYLIFSIPMPSSSAAIWGIAMRSPWPRSTLTMLRREKRIFSAGALMLASLSRCRHNGVHDPHMRAAAAEVDLKRRANVVLARLLFFGQQCCRAHDHAAGAVAALGHLMFDEGGLDRMRFRRRPQPFQRGDRLALRIRDGHLAGLHRRAVGEHRAGAALAKAAAELCRRQAEAAQHIEQRLVGIR